MAQVDIALTNKTFSREVQLFLYICLDRPLQLQEFEASLISRQSAHEDGKFNTPTHLPHLPPGDSSILRRCTIHNKAWTPEIVSEFVVFFFAVPERMLRYY